MTPSVMFHHFHDQYYYKSQGSISKEELFQIVNSLNKQYNIRNAKDYIEDYLAGNLAEGDISLSFDDGLLCQYDIALEVLDTFKIKAFWFIASHPIEKKQGNLEIYRYFRSKYFTTIDHFYDVFFEKVKTKAIDLEQKKTEFEHKKYLSDFSFYSWNDRFFRYLRDVILGARKYNSVMNDLLFDYGCDVEEVANATWMTRDHLLNLDRSEHVIGAHSYHHPTNLAKLTKKEQLKEYKKNIEHLETLLGKKVNVMAHPCNSYNSDTLEILKSLNIEMGFRSNNKLKSFSNLELPRIDHTEILKLV